MDRVKLGKTDLWVSRLWHGGLFLRTQDARFDVAKETVATALAAGVNYFDTAPGYGDSEEVLGKCLADVREPVVLSTKLGGYPEPFEPRSRDHLRRSVERSLRLLKRDTIDVLMVHEPDRPGVYDWWSDRDAVTGPVVEVLAELKQEGIVRYSGLGGTTAYELARLMRSGQFDVVLTAFNYSLLWREAEHEILPLARELDMGLIVGSPLRQGALARRYDEEILEARFVSEPRRQQLQALYSLLDHTGMELSELCLRFVLSNTDVHTVLMGARDRAEALQNVAAAERGALPADLVSQLNEIAAMVPFAPRDEPAGLGWILPHPGEYDGPGALA